MTCRTTLTLFVIVCVLGAVLWMMQRTVEPTDGRTARLGRALDIDLMHVEALTVQNGDTEMDLVHRGDDWWIVRPVEGRADEAMIGRLLSASEALICNETITREQREHRGLSLGDYGLDVPRTAVTFKTPLGTRRLLVGHEARLGKRMYVRLDGEPEVLLTDRALRDALPESVEVMRDRALMHGQPVRVTRLEIERPGGGFVQLLRSSTGWVVQQPVREPAAGAMITALLEELYAARIERFVWDALTDSPALPSDALPVAEAPVAPVESYGLAADTSPARVRLWESGDDIGRELTFGKPADAASGTVYAMFTDGGSVFTLDAALLKRFQLHVDDLRSRALVRMDPRQIRYLAVQQGDRKLTLGRTSDSGWSILEPIQWPADTETVSDVLRRLTEIRIQTFIDEPATNPISAGEDVSALHVTLDTVYPVGAGTAGTPDGDQGRTNGDSAALRCAVVAVDAGEDDLLLVQATGRQGRFLVRRDALGFLPEATAMPLAFFDRSMLEVSPEQVHRITAHREDGEQILERDAEGSWRALQPQGGRPVAEALSDVLFCVSNLRAERVADQNPKALDQYGLDQATTSLTLGLTGGDAIQKTILVGAAAGETGRYAMIQGQDVVFVLDQATVVSLLRAVATAAGQEAQP